MPNLVLSLLKLKVVLFDTNPQLFVRAKISPILLTSTVGYVFPLKKDCNLIVCIALANFVFPIILRISSLMGSCGGFASLTGSCVWVSSNIALYSYWGM